MPKRATYGRFLTVWAVALAVLAPAAAGLSWVVDPYGLNRAVDVAWLNRIKPQLATRTRMAKPYQVIEAGPRTLVVGNSRSEAGFDPEASVWKPRARPVFNLGIGGGGLYLQLRYLQHAIAAQEPDAVILGIDFFDFLRPPDMLSAPPPTLGGARESGRLLVAADGSPTADRWRHVALDWFANHLSMDALVDTAATVARQGSALATDRTALGFNSNRDLPARIRSEGQASIFDQADALVDRTMIKRDGRIKRLGPGSQPAFELLRAIVSHCHERGIEVHAFMHPYHARLLALIEERGLWDDFESWKRRTLEAFEEATPAGGEAPAAQLWDFALHSAYTTEAVPPRDDRRTIMRWYWEGGHYRAALGEVVVAEMLGRRPAGAEPAGVRLNGAMLEAHLRSARRLAAAHRDRP